MSEHGQKVCVFLGFLISFTAHAIAEEKEAIIEPYWEEITLNEFEEFPSVDDGINFPSFDDGKWVLDFP